MSRTFAASLAAGMLAMSACSGRPVPSAPGPEPALAGEHPRATYSLAEADVTVHEGARLRLRAHARQVMLVPRTFGPFEVAVLKQLVVSGVRITVEDQPACRTAPGCVDRFLGDPTLGLVSLAGGDAVFRLATGTIVDAGWTVRRGGSVVTRFGAREASIGIGGRDLVLDGFELEQLWADRRVRAGRAVWDPEAHAFWIAGDFVLEEGGSVRSGQGLLIGVTEPG